MKNIEKLFSLYMGDHITDTPEIRSALSKLTGCIEDAAGHDKLLCAEGMIGDLLIEIEQRGFIYGFRFGMQIAIECLVSEHR